MGKIDVHHHMLPAEYVQKWKEASGIPKGLTLPSWSVDLDLKFMDRNGIDVSILSLSAPGLAFVKSADGSMTVPSLDQIDSCLKEIRYALDVLKADGVALLSSYDDKYLGHSNFRPMWQELNRRKAVVFIHPTFAKAWGASSDLTIPRPIVDFPHETTQTAVNLIKSNIIHDFKDCKIILSHGGGTLPYVATRIAHQTADLGLKDKPADEFIQEAKSFYYDLSLTGYENPIKLVSEFAEPDHVLYGSDFPFAREGTIVPQITNIKTAAANGEVRQSIEFGAASKLFPRFSTWDSQSVR